MQRSQVDFSALPWEDTISEEDLVDIHKAILRRDWQTLDQQKLAPFCRQTDAVFVLQVTGQYGQGFDHELLFKHVTEALDGVDTDVKYGWGDSMGMAYDNSAKAFMYLESQQDEFSSDQLKTAHRRLMRNEPWRSKPIGEYRCKDACTATFCFSPPGDIADSVEWAIRAFLEEAKDRTRVICAIAKLVHRLLVIHPFEEGNRRICWLLAAAMLKRYKITPFAVSLCDALGNSTHEHFLNTIFHADRFGDTSKLASLLLLSLYTRWANFDRLFEE
jgi:fido (protein-threonine AMPylation protein)